MNQREKIVDAINYYEAQVADHEKQKGMVDAARKAESDARAELMRVLHAVYGHRATKGVVLRGKRYWLEFGENALGNQLHIDQADFEVLG